jgi:alkylation response protein AidB-like acyl-CoA dehydrogenase
MDFELSEDQELLTNTVREFVKKESPVTRMRQLRKTELGWAESAWKKMGELGWLGVMFPESAGGAGMSFVEMGLMLEQFGTTLVPEPLIPLIAAGVCIEKAGSAEQQRRFLTPSLAGEESLALAFVEEQSRHDPSSLSTHAHRAGSGYKLRGKKRFVLNGHAANHIVVSARTSGDERARDGVSLFAVDPGMPGLRIHRVEHMDGHKGAMIELKDVELSADRLLGPEGKAADVLELALDYGAAAACCEASGILQSVLWMTRDYLLQRKQFGVAIGSFQALQHRAVDMFVETELAKSSAILAMVKVEAADPVERQRAVSAAKTQTIASGGFVTRQGIQLHGGIGVTDEHDVGLYFKRMHILATLFGDEAYHVARYASLPGFA